jgi:hypothetical protein
MPGIGQLTSYPDLNGPENPEFHQRSQALFT